MNEHQRIYSVTKRVAIAGFVASCYSLIPSFLFGFMNADHSYFQNYISELGQKGAANAAYVNWLGLFPVGLLVLLFLYMARNCLPVGRKSLYLFSALGWAYVISAFFPCDAGCPELGSSSQMVHNLTALVCYPAIIFGLVSIANSFRSNNAWQKLSFFTMTCSLIAAIGFVLMLVPDLALWRGMMQRITETVIFGWIGVVSFNFWKLGESRPWLPFRI